MGKHDSRVGSHGLDDASAERRRVLRGLGAVGGALIGARAAHVLAADSPPAATPAGHGAGSGKDAATAPASQPAPGAHAKQAQVTDAPSGARSQDESHAFYGPRQAGVLTARPASGMVASFDVLAQDVNGLKTLFETLTARIAFLTQGGPAAELPPGYPPPDSGLLGPVIRPDALTVTVSVGASLFDQRFGLADQRPQHLIRMVRFPNDALDASLCHGDLLLQFCANTPDTNIHALRDVLKNLPGLLALRWKQEGSVPVVPPPAGEPAPSARNFLGFRDGSANPDTADTALMDAVVWVGDGQGEPAWATNGSYQAVRLIRNFVERWDRTPLREQEAIFGRRKASGAPLDGEHEADVPDYGADPEGKVTPLDAHIRLANPRTPDAARSLMLRRPFNYSNGVTRAGQLDMGLLFIAYQANLQNAFIAVQKRLDGEPLEEYIKPVGGGYFFVLPGVLPDAQNAGRSDYLGRRLLLAAHPTLEKS